MKKLLLLVLRFMFSYAPEADEDLTVEQTQLAQIEEMKQKMDAMVDPEEHQKLQKEYKTLMEEYVNKRPAPKQEVITHRPVKEIAKELVSIKSGDMSNRDYVVKSLEYRNSFMSEFGKDPFADGGEPTADTKEVAQVLQTLVDENPSPVEFRMKMNSVLKDDSVLVKALKRKRNKK